MFFPRLRRQAKWVFLFLALAMGLGFVAFGVGAGGVGVGDIFRGAGGDSGVPSVESAEKRVAENPKDAQAFQDLATAHQAEGNTDEAIEALESYVVLRPKDADSLRQLAGLYLAQAQTAQERAQIAEYRMAFLAPGASLAGAITLGGRPIEPDPISSAISSQSSGNISQWLFEAQQAAASAVETYKRVAAAEPDNPNVQLEVAQAAQNAGDTATAIAAYEAFLDAAPDDPQAPDVRRLLKQLRGSQG
jgi:tetratricopeptide (TPR) repeat protein